MNESEDERPSRFRFTLQSMFVTITMAAAAVWLFLRYAGFPGLFFAVTVLGAAWCVLRANKRGAVGYLAICAAAWLALQIFGPYTSLRNRVVWIVGAERLQQWAVEVLDDPPPLDNDGLILLERSTLPEDIRSVAGHYNTVVTSENDMEDAISLAHGGGFYHWGVIVGRPGFTPSYANRYDRIADGVWGYRE